MDNSSVSGEGAATLAGGPDDQSPDGDSTSFVPRIQRSLELLALARRCHEAATRVARAEAAVNAWPDSLTWRQERINAIAAQEQIEAGYGWALHGVPWAEWGLIQESGP